MSGSDSNPFAGPRPLEEKDGIFGRDEELRELRWFFTAERIVWLHSPSGAGKTSLIQSGLVPEMRTRGFDVLPVVRVNGPAEKELNRYEASVMACLGGTGDLQTWLGQTAGGRARVLIFDQFEEVVTLSPLDTDAKKDFFKTLGRVLEAPDIWALFVVREDYLAALDGYACYLPTLMNHRFGLNLLPKAKAKEAMKAIAAKCHDRPDPSKPCGEPHETEETIAARGGRVFDDDASEKLAEELSLVLVAATGKEEPGAFVEPVVMQVVCHSMWAGLKAGGRIGIGDIPKREKQQQAMADFYAACVQSVAKTVSEERRIRTWVAEKLIVNGIRNQALKSGGTVAGLDKEKVAELDKTGLVRRDPRVDGREFYELAHDRLVEAVLPGNASWAAAKLEPFQRRADVWRQDRSKTVLLTEAESADARKAIREKGIELTAIEDEFLRESEAEQAVRAWIRFLTRLGWVLAVAMTIATTMAVIAYLEATSREYVNLARKEVRDEQLGCAVQHGLKAMDKARYLGTDSKRGAMEALGEVLQGGAPLNKVNEAPIKLALDSAGTRLAVIAPEQVTLFSVSTTGAGNPERLGRWEAIGECKVNAAAFVPGSSSLVFGPTSGPVPEGTIPCGAGPAAGAVAVSSKGIRAIAEERGQLRIGDGTAVDLEAKSLAFRPDGELLAAGLKDGTVRILNLKGKEVQKLTLGGSVTSLKWRADVLAAASRDSGEARIWDSSFPIFPSVFQAEGKNGVNQEVSISPDGKLAAMIVNDFLVKVWDVGTQKATLELRVPPSKKAALTDVVFLGAGHLLVADDKGNVRRFALKEEGLSLDAKELLSKNSCPAPAGR